jgi:hypothetical protein
MQKIADDALTLAQRTSSHEAGNNDDAAAKRLGPLSFGLMPTGGRDIHGLPPMLRFRARSYRIGSCQLPRAAIRVCFSCLEHSSGRRQRTIGRER